MMRVAGQMMNTRDIQIIYKNFSPYSKFYQVQQYSEIFPSNLPVFNSEASRKVIKYILSYSVRCPVIGSICAYVVFIIFLIAGFCVLSSEKDNFFEPYIPLFGIAGMAFLTGCAILVDSIVMVNRITGDVCEVFGMVFKRHDYVKYEKDLQQAKIDCDQYMTQLAQYIANNLSNQYLNNLFLKLQCFQQNKYYAQAQAQIQAQMTMQTVNYVNQGTVYQPQVNYQQAQPQIVAVPSVTNPTVYVSQQPQIQQQPLII